MTETLPPSSVFAYIFQNPDLPADERITDLLSQMTLEEKVQCLSTDPSVPRLGVVGSNHIEGLHGVAMGEPGGWGEHGGKTPVPTTTFPQEIGLGETWDRDLIQKAAAVEGYEARYLVQHPSYRRGGLVVRAPNADLGRDPRWGRTEECYGEDPYFNGEMVAAFVRGLQGDDPRYWLSASLMKHFLANSNENGRENSSSNFDERLFREYYSVPFRRGIEAGSRAFMAAYNAYNGIPCEVHPMLKEIAVKEWGQDGIICTDGGAMKLLVTHHRYVPDEAHAVADIVKAGIGQFLDDYQDGAKIALETGLLTEADIDAALIGNFRVMLKLGQLDPPERVPYAQIGLDNAPEPWLSEAHQALALAVTQKSVVLLKNENGLLPLDRSALKSVAVLGARADQVLLDWYSGSPPYAVTPLAGLQSRLGNGTQITHADGSDLDAAVALARSAEAVIVCVGNHPTGDAGWAKVTKPEYGKEAVDRESIDLDEEVLIQAVFAVNPKTIVVLLSSFPYAINWTQEHIPAIVHLAQNSQELGSALADVLLGDFNPAGRLVQTWPKSLDQLPPMMDYNLRHGRTYLYSQETPLYPFGYGLSYTSFAYADLALSAATIEPAGTVDVTFKVTNAGTRTGEEVVQMYLAYPGSGVSRPQKALAGFARITFAPHETQTVTLPLAASQMSYWESDTQQFVLENGTVQVLIGSSSADIKLTAEIKSIP